MKKNLFFILLISISSISFGQLSSSYYLTFDNSYGMEHLTIDSISNSKNIWKIGAPQKHIFINAYSEPNAIVTDLQNSYPINDTSIFIITNLSEGNGHCNCSHSLILQGRYFVNSDTLTDYGKIEFSPNNGKTWIDLLNDTVAIDTSVQWYWSWYKDDKPTLTGNSNGWKTFYVDLGAIDYLFNIKRNDSILYRFTFISDSIQSNKDGLMFDDIGFEDVTEGIEYINRNELISIFPNPVVDQLTIKVNKIDKKSTVQIIDMTGKQIYYNNRFIREPINTTNFKNGLYLLKYTSENSFCIIKFIKVN